MLIPKFVIYEIFSYWFQYFSQDIHSKILLQTVRAILSSIVTSFIVIAAFLCLNILSHWQVMFGRSHLHDSHVTVN